MRSMLYVCIYVIKYMQYCRMTYFRGDKISRVVRNQKFSTWINFRGLVSGKSTTLVMINRSACSKIGDIEARGLLVSSKVSLLSVEYSSAIRRHHIYKDILPLQLEDAPHCQIYIC